MITSLELALQRGLPLESRPFDVLAAECGCTEREALDCVAQLRARGLVRRFGAVFDTRRLGYTTCLCAASVPPAALDATAAKLVPLTGVTHCYERSAAGTPNLWFTLSAPREKFEAAADEVRNLLQPYAVYLLPATRRYKVDVVFGGATLKRDESVEDNLPLTADDRRIVAQIQGDTEVRADYFAAIAEHLGMKEWDLLSTLELWRRNGRLKRIGLLLAHRAAGYQANAMCCWQVEGETTEAGRALAACPEVTHCYERPPMPGFNFNLYAMIHCKTHNEAEATFAALTERCALPRGTMLISTQEFKKTSMTFYQT